MPQVTTLNFITSLVEQWDHIRYIW